MNYTEKDLRNAFRAGDKYRLYLDKWATGIATKGLPSREVVSDTMNEDAYIESIKKKK